jgi:GNAT superfamily N-acetyltransferase
LYSLAYHWDRGETVQGLSTDLSNARKPDSGPDRGLATKIINFMTAHHLDSLEDLALFVFKKWHPDKPLPVKEVTQNTQYHASPGADIDSKDLQQLKNLVLQGSEVDSSQLENNLVSAPLIVWACQDQQPVGVVVLKKPLRSYRDSVFAKAGVGQQASVYDLELGYVYVLPQYRTKGVSVKLLAMMNRKAQGAVYATARTANTVINKMLAFAGFQTLGHSWSSARGDYKLQLWARDGGNLQEAPVADYQTLGDFAKPGPFSQVDRRLVTHPTNRLKTMKFFANTPYDIRLFFSNLPRMKNVQEFGAMTAKEVQQVFPAEQAQQIIQGHDNAITVVFIGNYGDAKVIMTPWIIAHRIGHAIQATQRFNPDSGAWRRAEQHFFKQVNDILQDYYHLDLRSSQQPQWQFEKQYAALFNAIGTQRSSRENKIRRPYEFLYELWAQYLGAGKIELKPLPGKIPYGRKAWGRVGQALYMRGPVSAEAGYVTQTLAHDMEIMFGDVLSELVGKILIM